MYNKYIIYVWFKYEFGPYTFNFSSIWVLYFQLLFILVSYLQKVQFGLCTFNVSSNWFL